MHYRVTTETNAPLQAGQLYLVDCGAQYRDGTDRRNAHRGPWRAIGGDARAFYAGAQGAYRHRVDALSRGHAGADLDGFARRAFWAAGRDHGHGTGHGVGSYLAVHEGPQAISRNGIAPLMPGMIFSNEPGYHREGPYGIRLENLCAVTEPLAIAGGETPMMGFETLTLAPNRPPV